MIVTRIWRVMKMMSERLAFNRSVFCHLCGLVRFFLLVLSCARSFLLSVSVLRVVGNRLMFASTHLFISMSPVRFLAKLKFLEPKCIQTRSSFSPIMSHSHGTNRDNQGEHDRNFRPRSFADGMLRVSSTEDRLLN